MNHKLQTAEHGMVATTHPQAAQIGVDVLKRGGNAIDAAIATSIAMGLMEPMSCGIGGDLFAIVWDAKAQKLHGLNASGRAPLAASIDLMKAKGLDELPMFGPLSWSVPGCVDGWRELHERFGTVKWSELFAPSIAFAEEGFTVPETISNMWANARERLSAHADSMRTYFPGDRSPKFGEQFRNPNLARTYRVIADGGAEVFYHGDIPRKIVEYSQQQGGLFSLEDFERHTSSWVDPVSTNYRGYDIWELPPPGQGIAAIEMLNVIEGFDVAKMGAGSADWWHLFLEAKKLAYADRAKHYADPEFAKVDVEKLISKEYAKPRAAKIDMSRAATDVHAGDLGSDTIYLCAVDSDRNCVSLIQSNYYGFGSAMVPGDLGFALQNRGTLFALDPAHANCLKPGKRPFHTIIPAMVTRDGRPWLTLGMVGGDFQVQGHVQVLVNMIDFGMDVQQAGDAPRLDHLGSASPKGTPANGAGTVGAEPGVSEEILRELERRGHTIERNYKNGGAYEAIEIDAVTGQLRGASETRRDGRASGY